MSKIRPLPEDLQKIAISELNEVPERVADDIEALKTWIDQQPHLKARTDDQWLLAFLRGCKFSLEKAKSKIDKYYTLKTKYPDFYAIQNVDDPRVLELIRYGVGLHLPTPLHENGPRIILIQAGIYPADKFTFNEVMCIAHSMQEIAMLEDDYAMVNGIIVIIDLSKSTVSHAFQMTPTVSKKMTTFSEEAAPLRERASHIIHMPAHFDMVFNALKPLMPAKQQERLFLHGNNLETLYQHIPQKYLPKEYGGENGSNPEIIANSEKMFLKYRNHFLNDANYRTDEKLRVGKPLDYEKIFGIDGSFRKLNVD